MRRTWRRSWPLYTLGVVFLIAMGANLLVGYLIREEPNYSQIEEGLYVGGALKQPPPGTKAVLNLCETADSYEVPLQKWEPIQDASPAPSIDWLREQVNFIDHQRKAGKVTFVHCRNGISRSGMVVVAYEMVKNGMMRDEALALVRAKRPEVRPNSAFQDLLLEWEKEVKGNR
ncbi:MAG TPA: dual specificity protein phosphatase [Gemmataceae bacterium]|nr:dual specificity protein phosphatase [Gemmataceae bacterium]